MYGFTEHFIYYSARLHGKYVAWKALNFRIFEDGAEWAGGRGGENAGGAGIIIRLHKHFSGFNVEVDQGGEHFL